MERKSSKNIVIKEAIDMFIKDGIVSGISKPTVGIREDAIKDFINHCDICYEDKIDIINKSLLDDYIIGLEERGLSLGSKKIKLSHLRSFLYWCMDRNYIEHFKVNMIKGQEAKLKFITDEDVKKLLVRPKKDCSYTEYRSYVIVCFLLSTGARASTLLNLKCEDVDMVNKTITYSHLKNKRVAVIPMSNSLYKVLFDYLKEWKRTDNTFFFCGNNEQQMTISSLGQSLNRYCKSRGVKRYGPHAFRHTFARMYIQNGGNAFTLQQFLTHSSLEMTRHYVELFSNDLRLSLDECCPLDNVVRYGNKTTSIRRSLC